MGIIINVIEYMYVKVNIKSCSDKLKHCIVNADVRE